jgi:hypothetical protein
VALYAPDATLESPLVRHHRVSLGWDGLRLLEGDRGG